MEQAFLHRLALGLYVEFGLSCFFLTVSKVSGGEVGSSNPPVGSVMEIWLSLVDARGRQRTGARLLLLGSGLGFGVLHRHATFRLPLVLYHSLRIAGSLLMKLQDTRVPDCLGGTCVARMQIFSHSLLPLYIVSDWAGYSAFNGETIASHTSFAGCIVIP
jgi:hypothetical protein